MENVNYQESIIIPTLQRKIQELTNANLVLEISLLVEQTKNKDITNHYTSKLNNTNLEEILEQKEKTIINIKNDMKTLADELNKTRSSLSIEFSHKVSALDEYATLKGKYTALMEENTQLKTNQKKPSKKQEQPSVVLDGATY